MTTLGHAYPTRAPCRFQGKEGQNADDQFDFRRVCNGKHATSCRTTICEVGRWQKTFVT
jgi:hypothetical protein